MYHFQAIILTPANNLLSTLKVYWDFEILNNCAQIIKNSLLARKANCKNLKGSTDLFSVNHTHFVTNSQITSHYHL